MASTARRTSGRLSSGSATNDHDDKQAPLSSTAATTGGNTMKRRSGEGVQSGSGAREDAAGDSKRQRTQPPAGPTKNPRAAPFKPAPLPPEGNTSARPTDNDDDDDAPPPPPPTDLRTARKRSSVRALVAADDSLLSPERVGGLEDEASLGAELGAERGRWKEMVSEPNGSGNKTKSGSTAATSSASFPPAALDFLNFSAAPKPSVHEDKPDTPPRNATLQVYQTPAPSARSRRISTFGRPAPSGANPRMSVAAAGADTDTLVPIPIEDTPMIKRNQEMRKGASKRSSLGLRGQRMSESLSRGDLTPASPFPHSPLPGAPHYSVPSDTFYKHISPTLPEPVRTRHLLIFCLQRAVRHDKKAGERAAASKSRSAKGKEAAHTPEGDRLVDSIMEDVLQQLGRGRIDTNVFSKPGEAKPSGQLRPHPRNVANLENKAKGEKYIQHCKTEDGQWSRLIAAQNGRLGRVQELLKQDLPSDDIELDAIVPERAAILAQWLEIAERAGAEIGDVAALGEGEVEYNIDTIHQSSHTALQYTQQAGRFIEGIFAGLNHDLRTRERLGETASSIVDHKSSETALLAGVRAASSSTMAATSSNPMDMLRALAAAEARESGEVVATASSLPPVPAAASGGGGLSTAVTPRRGTATLTPKRPDVPSTTPRRLGPGSSRFAGGSRRNNGDEAASPGA